jgi:hypothetical protein
MIAVMDSSLISLLSHHCLRRAGILDDDEEFLLPGLGHERGLNHSVKGGGLIQGAMQQQTAFRALAN